MEIGMEWSAGNVGSASYLLPLYSMLLGDHDALHVRLSDGKSDSVSIISL